MLWLTPHWSLQANTGYRSSIEVDKTSACQHFNQEKNKIQNLQCIAKNIQFVSARKS